MQVKGLETVYVGRCVHDKNKRIKEKGKKMTFRQKDSRKLMLQHIIYSSLWTLISGRDRH